MKAARLKGWTDRRISLRRVALIIGLGLIASRESRCLYQFYADWRSRRWVGILAVLGINLGSHFDARWGALFDRPKARQGALRQRESPGGEISFYIGPLRMSAFGTKRTSLVAPHMSAFGGKADMISDRSSRKRFSYFLLGRLRFGDDVASRRFAHLVSDGLPLI